MNTIAQFQDAMRAAGLTPPDQIVPGRLHRFSTNGKQRDDAGWCRLFDDAMGGVYGDHRTGLSKVWQAKRDRAPSATELEAFRRKVAEGSGTAGARGEATPRQGSRKGRSHLEIGITSRRSPLSPAQGRQGSRGAGP